MKGAKPGRMRAGGGRGNQKETERDTGAVRGRRVQKEGETFSLLMTFSLFGKLSEIRTMQGMLTVHHFN